jgi:hypothetical protein
MEEEMEMEEDSRSTVTMSGARGTFTEGTTDGTVTEDSTRLAYTGLITGAFFLGFRAEYLVNAQSEPKTKILLRFAQPSPGPSNFPKVSFQLL